MKTSELSEAALDWAVAKAEGMHVDVSRGGWIVFDSDAFHEFRNDYNDDKLQKFSPSTNWAQGGEIIEREKIGLHCGDGTWGVKDGAWEASHPNCLYVQRGATPLEAAMRVYVASKLGDEVQIPEGV